MGHTKKYFKTIRPFIPQWNKIKRFLPTRGREWRVEPFFRAQLPAWQGRRSRRRWQTWNSGGKPEPVLASSYAVFAPNESKTKLLSWFCKNRQMGYLKHNLTLQNDEHQSIQNTNQRGFQGVGSNFLIFPYMLHLWIFRKIKTSLVMPVFFDIFKLLSPFSKLNHCISV